MEEGSAAPEPWGLEEVTRLVEEIRVPEVERQAASMAANPLSAGGNDVLIHVKLKRLGLPHGTC